MNHYYSEDCRLLNFFRTATIVLVAIWGLFGLGVLGFSILKKQYDVLNKKEYDSFLDNVDAQDFK